MLSPGRLLHWARLHDRRAARNAPTRWLIPAAAVVLGIGLAAAMSRTVELAEASRLWVAALIGLTALVFVTAPFRMFWSRDATALARQPVPGRALFRLGVYRNARIALGCAVPTLLALPAFAIAGSVAALARHAVLAVVALSASALLGPAVAVLAGALAASERADAIARSFGGEFRAPRGAHMGIVPGVLGAGVVLGLIAGRSWAAGGGGAPCALLVVVAVSAIAIAVADRFADQVVAAAVRELAALNRRRLAHVEVTSLGPVEGLATALAGRARPVVDKDFRLLRRRHPAYSLAVAGTTLAAWIGAFTSPSARDWITVLLFLVQGYSVVMAWRALAAPIENVRLLAVLPFTPARVRSAKRIPLHARSLTNSVFVGSALVRASSWPWASIVIIAAAALATLLGSIVVARRAM